MNQLPLSGVMARGLLYLLAGLFLGELVNMELEWARSWRPFTEYGYVQLFQSLALGAAALLLFLKAWRNESHRQLSVCMALFFVSLLIRENDQPLELFLPHGSWKFLVLIPVGIFVAYFWKHRGSVVEQLTEYAQTLSFGVMLSGFLVLAFSRLFGRRSFWTEVMGDNYLRMVKNAAEEGVELLAIGIILIAVIEYFLLWRRKSEAE